MAAESEVERDHPGPCRDVAATASLDELMKRVQRLERVVEQIGGVPVPQIWEPIVDGLQLVPQERVQNRTREQFVNVPVPQITDEIVDGVQVLPQECVQNRVREQFVDVSVSHNKEEIVDGA